MSEVVDPLSPLISSDAEDGNSFCDANRVQTRNAAMVLDTTKSCPHKFDLVIDIREKLLSCFTLPDVQEQARSVMKDDTVCQDQACYAHKRIVRFGRVNANSLQEVNIHGARHLIWPCRQKAGLGALVLRFLGLAHLAEEVGGFDGVHIDTSDSKPYGDLSALFPLDQEVAISQRLTLAEGLPCRRWQGFALGRGCREGRALLTQSDAEVGRQLLRKYVRVAAAVIDVLENYVATMDVREALGVHVRRTDKGCEAPSNLEVTVEEAAAKTLRVVEELGLKRVFLAGDDAAFLTQLREKLTCRSPVSIVIWPSRLSLTGRAVHYDRKIPGVEAAADALADAFCLSRCRCLLSTFSCLSVWATLWSPDSHYRWWHFRYPQLAENPWASTSPIDGWDLGGK